jgi:PEP-CTERM motif
MRTLLTFFSILLLLAGAPAAATPIEVVSGFASLDWSGTWDWSTRVTGGGIDVFSSYAGGDLFGTINSLPAGHTTFDFCCYFINYNDGTTHYQGTLHLDFTYDPIHLLEGPIIPGALETSPFTMTGFIDLPGVATADLVGHGLAGATWRDVPYYGLFSVGFSFVPVPEPTTLILAMLGLVAIAALHRRRSAKPRTTS